MPYRPGSVFIHGKQIAPPVTGNPEFAKLLENQPAILIPPFPDILKKLFATEIVARHPFFAELFFNNGLSSDTGMVGTRKPESFLTRHALITDKNILQRVIQNMTKSKTAGDIWRRHKHRIRLLPSFKHSEAFRFESTFRLPVGAAPAALHIMMIVRFFEVYTHY